MADLEILKGVSALQKRQPKLKVKTKKKVITSSVLSHFLLAAASLPFSTAPKSTHQPYFRVIFALRDTNRRWLGVHALLEGFQLKLLQPPVSTTDQTLLAKIVQKIEIL